jgi:hypothetical protein
MNLDAETLSKIMDSNLSDKYRIEELYKYKLSCRPYNFARPFWKIDTSTSLLAPETKRKLIESSYNSPCSKDYYLKKSNLNFQEQYLTYKINLKILWFILTNVKIFRLPSEWIYQVLNDVRTGYEKYVQFMTEYNMDETLVRIDRNSSIEVPLVNTTKAKKFKKGIFYNGEIEVLRTNNVVVLDSEIENYVRNIMKIASVILEDHYAYGGFPEISEIDQKELEMKLKYDIRTPLNYNDNGRKKRVSPRKTIPKSVAKEPMQAKSTLKEPTQPRKSTAVKQKITKAKTYFDAGFTKDELTIINAYRDSKTLVDFERSFDADHSTIVWEIVNRYKKSVNDKVLDFLSPDEKNTIIESFQKKVPVSQKIFDEYIASCQVFMSKWDNDTFVTGNGRVSYKVPRYSPDNKFWTTD